MREETFVCNGNEYEFSWTEKVDASAKKRAMGYVRKNETKRLYWTRKQMYEYIVLW